MNKYRHGDVIIAQTEKKELASEVVKEAVLANGEVTGHRHLLVADRPTTKMRIAHDGNGFYLEIEGGTATVMHEEHAPITLQPGSYTVRVQQEYDPATYRRNVQD